jgi:mRNA interferase MazF
VVVTLERGDIYLANLEPSLGSEADKVRPVLIVSNDGANRSVARTRRGVITIVPLTSNSTDVRSFQAFVAAEDSGLRSDSKIQAEQVRSISPSRLGKHLGHVPESVMSDVSRALRVHLDL